MTAGWVTRMANGLANLLRGIWGARVHVVIALILAAVLVTYFKHRWPEHPVDVSEFTIVWIVMFIPSALLVALWRRLF